MIEKIRQQLTERGGMNGIRSLGRVFKIMDDSGNAGSPTRNSSTACTTWA